MGLQDDLEAARQLRRDANEANTSRAVVDVFRSLGWNSSTLDQEFSVPAASGGSGGRADIALMCSGDTPAILVEVKKPATNLLDQVDQLFQYLAFQSTMLSVLTNGHEWWLYLPRQEGTPSQRRFAVVNLREQDIAEASRTLRRYLKQDAVCSGEAEEEAISVLKQMRLETVWNEMQERPPRELLRLIQERGTQAKDLKPTQDEIREYLMGIAHGQPLPGPVTDGDSSTRPSIASTGKVSKKQPKSGDSKRKPSAFVLFGNRHLVNSWAAVLVGVAEQLHQRHESKFHQALELRGKKRRQPLIGRSKGDVFRGRQISDSEFWININHSSERVIYWCHELLKKFGHSPDDLQIE